MRRGVRVTGIGLAAVVCVSTALLAGCSGTVSGTAEKAKPSVEGADLFDPCKQLSDDVLRQAGLDPSTKDVVTDAPKGAVSARVCDWHAVAQHDFNVGIFSTKYTLDQVRQNTELTDFKDVTVGPRKGVRSRQVGQHMDPNCNIAMEAAQGDFEVDIGWQGDVAPSTDLCEVAMRFAAELEPHLPK